MLTENGAFGIVSRAVTLPGLVAHAARNMPDKPCAGMAKDPDAAMSYAGMATAIVSEAARLRATGVGPGTHVSLMLPRSVEYLVAYFAVLACGGVAVPLSTELTAPEIAADLAYCDVALSICTEDLADRFPAGQRCLTAAMADPRMVADPAAAEALDDLALAIDPEATALLLHTSGTMSHPKRVMLSHRNVLANAQAHGRSIGAGRNDRVLIVLPMHFGYCNTAQIVTHLLFGGSLYLAGAGFSSGAFRRTVARCVITTTTLVPTMLNALASERGPAEPAIPSLRSISFGGGPVDGARLRALARRQPGVELIQTYGQTEAGPRLTTRRRAETASDCAGTAIDGVRLTIRDSEGAALPAGRPGEVCAAGPGIMQGYYKNAAATAEVLRDGWLHTGDLGVLSPQGELSVIGRSRNVIIRGGQNVYPEQIEAVLKNHEAVAEAVVIGAPHDFQGEVPVALLVAHPGPRPGEAALLAYCRALLSPVKIPARFEWRDRLPKTYNQKIARSRLSAGSAGDDTCE